MTEKELKDRFECKFGKLLSSKKEDQMHKWRENYRRAENALEVNWKRHELFVAFQHGYDLGKGETK